ncbi:hypothetical protein E2553_32195 [Paraburkholderia dipogonis]|uniref:Uncharacterized protein n=1 Tax=Paraburkholderia dipogonis TaxID=1211383 RepID=A0A4Y8MUV9_9BURK|nr:hypothetical protein [Paraburkholderia dipogonis]TFE41336.1 hypothetical protein E2553_32195 [Paraburkholderia dipogonis]
MPERPVRTLYLCVYYDATAARAQNCADTHYIAGHIGRIGHADGTISLLANDFQDARDVAVDTPRGKLNAIDRAASASGTSYVRSFPLN